MEGAIPSPVSLPCICAEAAVRSIARPRAVAEPHARRATLKAPFIRHSPPPSQLRRRTDHLFNDLKHAPDPKRLAQKRSVAAAVAGDRTFGQRAHHDYRDAAVLG